jgi:hypothetical protein
VAKLAHNDFSVTIGTTDTLLLSANPRRVGLYISPPLTNHVTLAFKGMAAVLDSGMQLFPDPAPPPDFRGWG